MKGIHKYRLVHLSLASAKTHLGDRTRIELFSYKGYNLFQVVNYLHILRNTQVTALDCER